MDLKKKILSKSFQEEKSMIHHQANKKVDKLILIIQKRSTYYV